ncbi:MAG: LuxR C-terminal-related transcriptional regulator [Bacteroidales bacterium]|nr:LuxR C-terminal-related transcriptional regulator [Bacteroidales bacterium]MDD4638160.1 LuxR C-terminal-related transcriptional regulator [Bacteroidales bacterium]
MTDKVRKGKTGFYIPAISIYCRALLLVATLMITLLIPRSLCSQEKKRSDMEINELMVREQDTISRLILPHKITSATIKKNPENLDSLTRSQQLISEVISLIDKGDLAPALFKIYDAINICPPREKKTYAIANSYYAIIQVREGNRIKAVNTLNMCDSLIYSLNDKNLTAFHYNNLGLFNQKFFNQANADRFFKQSLSISRSIGDETSVAVSLNNLSKGEGDYVAKAAYIKEAIEINSRLKRELPLADNYNTYAGVLFKLGNLNEAVRYLNLAAEIAERLVLPEILYNNYELRSKINYERGNYAEAYRNSIKMLEYQQKINDQVNIREIEQVVTNRLLSEKQYEIDIQKKENSIRRLNVTLIIIISFLIITLLLSFYIWHYINSRRKMQKLQNRQMMAEQEIKYANTELLNLSSYLSSRNEILSNIQTSLSRIQKMGEKEIYQEIRKTNLYIKNLQTKNEDVDSVIRKIEKINQDFISKLTEKHPDLTKNDKNIALLLRANLSTKQISTIMDCSPKSVNMARYRMRTHLGIANDTNLVSYLKSL